MSLTVLNVAFPFAPVGADAVGGAEQVVAQLDRALVAAGQRSLIIACAGSQTAGRLLAVPCAPGLIDETVRAETHRRMRTLIAQALCEERIDVMHFHGLDHAAYLPPYGPPALVSLHLPLHWYASGDLRPRRPRTWLLPVSAHQARHAPRDVALLAPIGNGVTLPARSAVRRRGFALALGRLCAEKGFADAIDAARRAGVPLLLAGSVFPWAEHRRHFETEIAPRLDALRRWIGPVGGARKRRLLAAARCLLVPSRVEETSSLVAMEAIAAGTPVIAYRAGALSDIVEDGVTGFLVDDVAAMAAAIPRCAEIDATACRRSAAARFDAQRTAQAHLALYRRLVGTAVDQPPQQQAVP
jgi:glycosyltransferase involved in cell wall biosynthesis